MTDRRSTRRFFEWIVYNPIDSILIVISSVVIIIGLYLVSPFYVPTEAATMPNALSLRWLQRAISVFYLIPGVTAIYGVYSGRRPLVRLGAFLLFVLLIFTTALRIATIGVTPVVWLFILALGMIAAVVYISLGARHR